MPHDYVASVLMGLMDQDVTLRFKVHAKTNATVLANVSMVLVFAWKDFQVLTVLKQI
jgi:hypothetical protein